MTAPILPSAPIMPSAFLRSLRLRWYQPQERRRQLRCLQNPHSTTNSWRILIPFNHIHNTLTDDEPKFSCAHWLIQLLDASIATQRIALDLFVKFPFTDDDVLDHRALDEYLENNVEILDACHYFVEKIEMIKKYVDTLRLASRLVDHGSANPHSVSLRRALDHLESCQDIERKSRVVMGKRSSSLIRRILKQKLAYNHESELSEVLGGSKAMALMVCRFLELGLSFESKTRLTMKVQSHLHEHKSCSWLRLLLEMEKQPDGGEKLKKRRGGNLMMMSELKQTVCVCRGLRERIKGKREKELVNSCAVEGLKRSLRELDDGIEVIEEKVRDLFKSLIDVRMALLGMISKA